MNTVATDRIAIVGPADLVRLGSLMPGPRPPTSGYAAPAVSDLAIELHRRGRHVDVITLSPNAEDAGTFSGDRFNLQVRAMRPRLRWVDAFAYERRQILEMIDRSSAEILHAQWTYEFALAAMSSARPTIVTVRDWGPKVLAMYRTPYRAVRLGMQVRVLRRARHLVANSPLIADRVQRVTRRAIPVVPNGAPFPAAMPLRLEPPAPVVGALNSGDVRLKNVRKLIEAFAQVRRAMPEASLRLAGTGFGPGETAERWALDNGLTSGVEFVGALAADDVGGFLRGLTLFVHPSLEESFGMVLIEATREGVPVVGGRSSGAVAWVLNDGADGSLVDVTSADALARTIVELLRRPADERLKMAESAFLNARDRFSIEKVASSYERLYSQVLSSADLPV